MDQGQQEKLGAATGIAFVIVSVLAFVFGPDAPPGFNDSPQQVADYVRSNRDELQAATALFLVAGPLFLWFLGSLARTLRLAEGRGPGRLAAVSFAGGIVALALAEGGQGIQWASSYHGDLDPGTVRSLWDAGVAAFLLALGIGIVTLVAAASLVGMRTGALPGWLAGGGIVLALYTLATCVVATFQETGAFSAADGALGLIAYLLFLLWTLAVSIVLVRGAGTAAEQASPAG